MKRLLLCALILAPIFLSGCLLDTIVGDFVNSAPRAVIDAAPSEGVAPLTVSFDAHYSRDEDGSIVEYHWDFGDPVDRSPVRGSSGDHTYSHAGTYLATLTVIDEEGASDSQQIAVVVANPPPVPQIVVSNDNPLPGREVFFDASTSYDLGGTIVDYEWDFGDEITAGGVNARHTYVSGGYYVVTLTLMDDDGETASTHVGINVQPGLSRVADDSTCSGGDPKPYAVIEAWPNPFTCSGGSVDQPITFDGRASRAGVGVIVTYYWDFGDGETATGQRVTHTYTRSGRYTIHLTVTNDTGETSTAPGAASINPDY
ncbi:MAG: PKD domain-containing protein [Candidatus Bipolaricaulia bacterium]